MKNIKIRLTEEEFDFINTKSNERNVTKAKYLTNILKEFNGQHNLFFDNDLSYNDHLMMIKLDIIIETLRGTKIENHKLDIKVKKKKQLLSKTLNIRLDDASWSNIKFIEMKSDNSFNTIVRKLIQIKMLSKNSNAELRKFLDKLNLIIFMLETIHGSKEVNLIKEKYYKNKNKNWNS